MAKIIAPFFRWTEYSSLVWFPSLSTTRLSTSPFPLLSSFFDLSSPFCFSPLMRKQQTQPLEQAKPPCTSIIEGWCFSYFKSGVLTIKYRRIPKVTAPVTFGFSRQKVPSLSGGCYLREAVTFGWLKYVCTVTVVLVDFRQSVRVTHQIKVPFIYVLNLNYPHNQTRLYKRKRP